MRSLIQIENNKRTKGPDARETDLFFRALFRLGVWAGDWEAWYGTKPLAGGITKRPARGIPPSTPLDRPSG